MRVLIGLATRGNDLHPDLVKWMLHKHGDFSVDLHMEVSPFSAVQGQEKIFNTAYTQGYDYVLVLDSDVTPPIGCVATMVSREKDILTAPIWHYDGKTRDIHLNIGFGGIKREDRIYIPEFEGMERITTASFGCMLVRRNVLAGFVEKGEKFTETSDLLKELPDYRHNSDNVFFKKAAILGYEAWVDWSLQPTVHSRIVDLCNETIINLIQRSKPWGQLLS